MPARPTTALQRLRLPALLLAGAAVVLAVLSALTTPGLAPRPSPSPSLTGSAARATTTTAARGVANQTIERGLQAALQAADSRTGDAPALPLAAVLAAVLLLAAAALRTSSGRHDSPLRGRAGEAARNRGPPRAAVRLV